MANLNPSTINSVNSGDSKHDQAIRKAYRLLQIVYYGRFLLARNHVCPVKNETQAEEAQRLVYTEYRKKDLCASNSAGMYFTPHSFLSTTTILCARNRADRLVGTSSIIEDGRLGLPADLLYQVELDEMRAAGRKLVEVGALALDGKKFRKGYRSLGSLKKLATMMTLFSGIFRYSYQHAGASHLVIMVNPRHESIYKFIGFERFSEVRHYPKVGKPAVPMILDIEATLSKCGDDLPSLCLVSGFGTPVPVSEFRFTALDLAKRAEKAPGFFFALTECEAAALAAEHLLFGPIIEFLRSSVWAEASKKGTESHGIVGDTLLVLMRQALGNLTEATIAVSALSSGAPIAAHDHSDGEQRA